MKIMKMKPPPAAGSQPTGCKLLVCALSSLRAGRLPFWAREGLPDETPSEVPTGHSGHPARGSFRRAQSWAVSKLLTCHEPQPPGKGTARHELWASSSPHKGVAGLKAPPSLCALSTLTQRLFRSSVCLALRSRETRKRAPALGTCCPCRLMGSQAPREGDVCADRAQWECVALGVMALMSVKC